MSQPILLVGAGGWLGQQVLVELRRAGAGVRVLLRGGENHPKASRLTAAGGEVIAGDLADPNSLLRATQHVRTIISTVQGGPDVIIEGQAALAHAGKQNGAARIFTSDYSVRLDGVTESEHLFLGWRARARAAVAVSGLAQVNPLNGAFMEMLTQAFFGLIDWKSRAVTYWGDPDQLYQFTTTGDVAAYVAAAALDPNLAHGAFEIVGDTASPRMLAALAQEATGAPFELKSLGDLAALDAEIARRTALAPTDPSTWAGLQYHRLMANGAGWLHSPQNMRFGGIQPVSIRQWLAAREETA